MQKNTFNFWLLWKLLKAEIGFKIRQSKKQNKKKEQKKPLEQMRVLSSYNTLENGRFPPRLRKTHVRKMAPVYTMSWYLWIIGFIVWAILQPLDLYFFFPWENLLWALKHLAFVQNGKFLTEKRKFYCTLLSNYFDCNKKNLETCCHTTSWRVEKWQPF